MATFTITGQVKLRNDTAANWTSENPVLSQGELGIETDTLKAKIGDGTTAWNSLGYAWGGVSPDKTRMVEFIVGTQTASTASLTGVTEDSELYDGKCINYYLPFASKSNATMNLTLADGTTTGAKPIYIVGTTRLGTQYGAGTIFSMVYSGTKDAWYCGNYYNSNTYDRTYWNTNLVASQAIVAGHIIVGDASGYKHANTDVSFDITYPVLYASGAVKANATFANAYVLMPSINPNTTVTGWSDSEEAELKSTVYFVGTLSGTTFTLDSTTFMTCNVPTTEDGKIYIPIGVTSGSIKTSMYFRQGTEMFYYKDGAFREYSYLPTHSHSYNDLTDKPTIPTVPTNVSSFTNDSGYITSAHEINNNRNVEYIVGTQTAATGAWKGVTQDTQLYDGKRILYYLPFAGSGNATLELTYPDGTTTGAQNCYYMGTTRLTTHYGAGNVIPLTYVSAKGWMCDPNYDANTYDRTLLNDIRVYAGTNKIMNYSLIMEKADGTWESFTTTGGAGTSKTKNTSGFRLGKIWVYNYNETIAANALTRNDYLYDCMPHTLTYSTNCGTTLVARKPVYLVGTVGSDGLFYLDNTWWTQTEPSTEDGKVYIYLGDAYSTSAIYFVANNPIYEYRNGAFRLYSGSKRITTTDIDEILAGQ